jgi:hypothetical protein
MKEVEIIPLARRKMARRGISESWVVDALRSPDQVVQGHGGRFVGGKNFFGLFLRKLKRTT